MPELSDAEYRQLIESQTLLNKLYNNKETKRDLERMAKKVNPNAVTTDDLAEPYLADIKNELKELREFKDGINKMQGDYQENQSWDRLRSEGYTQTGIDEIKKLMTDRNIKDPEIAAAYWDKTRPPEMVAPNGISPSMWNFENTLQDDPDDMKLLLKNDDAWLDRTSAKFFNEKR